MTEEHNFVIDQVDYPYREYSQFELFKITRPKQFYGYCLNRSCSYFRTNLKKLFSCPFCNHSLYWSARVGVKK